MKSVHLGLALVILAALVAVMPVYWLISSSFKTPDEAYARPVRWVPQAPSFSNYEVAFQAGQIGQPFFNSVVVAATATALAFGIGYPAAFRLSRYRGGSAPVLFLPAVFSLAPPVVFVIPLVVYYAAIGLIDSFLGLALVYGGVSAFYIIWITKPFIDAIPRELEEAARVDGEDDWAIPFTVILPLIASGVLAAIFFVFLLNWTGFVMALSLTRAEVRTLPIALTVVRGQGGVPQAQGTAAAVGTLSLAPFLAISYLMQRYFLRAFAHRFGGR